MTYKKIFDLKYKAGMSTHDLLIQFPDSLLEISEIALLDVSEEVLREVVQGEAALNHILSLKKRYFGSSRRKT